MKTEKEKLISTKDLDELILDKISKINSLRMDFKKDKQEVFKLLTLKTLKTYLNTNPRFVYIEKEYKNICKNIENIENNNLRFIEWKKSNPLKCLNKTNADIRREYNNAFDLKKLKNQKKALELLLGIRKSI